MNQFKPFYRNFFIIFLLFSGTAAFAQSDPLEKKATISAQKELLENVLNSITKQTGVRFSYNSKLIDPKTNVTVHAQNKTVKEILTIILPPAISYKKVGIYVVLHQVESRKQKAESEKKEEKLLSNNGKGIDSSLNNINAKNIDSIRTEKEEMIRNITELTPTDTTATTFVFAKDTQNVEIQEKNIDFQEEEHTSKRNKPFQASFVYTLGTAWAQSDDNTYSVSISVLGSRKGQTNTFAPVQAAGLWNFAQQSNCQIAGVINVTKKGKFQIGLVNVRDTADGLSLGLINIVKQGGVMEAGIESDEFVHTALTLRTGVKRLYTIVSVGYNYTDCFWSLSSGFGTSLKLAKNLNMNFELTYTTLNDNILGQYSLTQISPVINYRFAKHFKVYIGPSLNLYVQNDHFKHAESPRLINIPHSFLNQTFNYIWAGITGDIKFRKKIYLYNHF